MTILWLVPYEPFPRRPCSFDRSSLGARRQVDCGTAGRLDVIARKRIGHINHEAEANKKRRGYEHKELQAEHLYELHTLATLLALKK